MPRMKYQTPHDFEQAIKTIARSSIQDTNRALQDFYIDRFLARVFHFERPLFVLKGGRSILAKTINARRTTDTDFAFNGSDLNNAKKALIALASIDLNDFLDYVFVKETEIADENEYRSGLRLSFDVYIGKTKKITNMKIDIVSEIVNADDFELIEPVNILPIPGISFPKYCVFPQEHSIADKVCALIQKYNGIESSRIKDLVDLVIYCRYEINGSKLEEYIILESSLRRLETPIEFSFTTSWINKYRTTYSKLAKEARFNSEFLIIENALILVKNLIDPAIAKEVTDKSWNPITRKWERATKKHPV